MPRQRNIAPEDSRNLNTRDTKKWCRGVVGREHKPQWVPNLRRHFKTDLVWTEKLICQECQKQLDSRDCAYPFGKLVRLAREHRGWSQEDLGLKVDGTAAYIEQIETDGLGSPTIKTIAKFAHALKVRYRMNFLEMPISAGDFREPDWHQTGWIG